MDLDVSLVQLVTEPRRPQLHGLDRRHLWTHRRSRERRVQLPGFEFVAEDIGRRRALVAAAANRDPGVVMVELGPHYSITILSYDDVVELSDLAARLVPVDEQQWVTGGGQMLDCVPFEPGCAPSDEALRSQP